MSFQNPFSVLGCSNNLEIWSMWRTWIKGIVYFSRKYWCCKQILSVLLLEIFFVWMFVYFFCKIFYSEVHLLLVQFITCSIYYLFNLSLSWVYFQVLRDLVYDNFIHELCFRIIFKTRCANWALVNGSNLETASYLLLIGKLWIGHSRYKLFLEDLIYLWVPNNCPPPWWLLFNFL